MDGVSRAQTFVLFLNDGCLARPWVRREVACALRLRKRVVVLHETDARHGAPLTAEGAFDFARVLGDAAPELGEALLRHHEAIPYRRQGDERAAMIARLLRQARLDEAAPDGRGAGGGGAAAGAAADEPRWTRTSRVRRWLLAVVARASPRRADDRDNDAGPPPEEAGSAADSELKRVHPALPVDSE